MHPKKKIKIKLDPLTANAVRSAISANQTDMDNKVCDCQ